MVVGHLIQGERHGLVRAPRMILQFLARLNRLSPSIAGDKNARLKPSRGAVIG